MCCISSIAAEITDQSRACGKKYGCYRGYCWSDCNMMGIYTGWCYTTYSLPGIPSFISCLKDSQCNACLNCGDLCTAASPMPDGLDAKAWNVLRG